MDREKKLILVIDDDKTLRSALNEIIEDAGYDVINAENGEEGLKIALERKPDLMFVDLIMPVMDGLEMIDKLIEDSWGKEANMIVLTNVDDIEGLSSTVKEKGYKYLVKTDLQIEEIVGMIKEELGE